MIKALRGLNQRLENQEKSDGFLLEQITELVFKNQAQEKLIIDLKHKNKDLEKKINEEKKAWQGLIVMFQCREAQHPEEREEKSEVGEIDNNQFSNNYEDEYRTICKICHESLKYGHLGSHLYQSDSPTKIKDYVKKYGMPDISKRSYHECAIRQETLLFVRFNLLTHVKTKHK